MRHLVLATLLLIPIAAQALESRQTQGLWQLDIDAMLANEVAAKRLTATQAAEAKPMYEQRLGGMRALITATASYITVQANQPKAEMSLIADFVSLSATTASFTSPIVRQSVASKVPGFFLMPDADHLILRQIVSGRNQDLFFRRVAAPARAQNHPNDNR